MARPRLGAGNSERLNMFISREELEQIETWQSENRVQSKSDAIRRLCQMGLAFDRERVHMTLRSRRAVELVGQLIESLDQLQGTPTNKKRVATAAFDLLEAHTQLMQGLLLSTAGSQIMKAPADVGELLQLTSDHAEGGQADPLGLLKKLKNIPRRGPDQPTNTDGTPKRGKKKA